MNSKPAGNPPSLALLPNWLGDFVMALPALRHLREEGPVVAVGASPLIELVRDQELADATIRYERRGADRGLLGLWRTARRCAAYHPRQTLIFPPSLRAAVLALLSGSSGRRGHPSDGRRLLLDDPYPEPRPRRQRHLADVWLAMAKGEPVRDRSATPRCVPGEEARRALERLRGQQPGLKPAGAFAVLAPAVQFGPAKQWPVRHFRSLAEKLHEDLELQVVVVAGPSAQEGTIAEAVARSGTALNLAGRTDLLALSALLHEAALFVGNDSGPVHLAAAMGTASVGVFGSTNPAWTGPRGPRVRLVGPHPVPCTPCYRKACPIGLPCLEELQVEEVWQAVVQLMGEKP